MNSKIQSKIIATLTLCLVLALGSSAMAQEKKTLDGMVQIERNHLYMIPVGSNEGLIKGDLVEIFRVGVKVAEARLISVLSDSSMIEMIKFINITDVFESDSIEYTSNAATTPKVRQTLSTEPIYTDEADISVALSGRKSKGLLGSRTSVGEEIFEAKAPLQKEATSLRQGMEALKQEYDEKIEAVLETAKGGRARTVVKVDEKWRQKYQEAERDYEQRLADQRASLEAEYAKEKERLENEIEALSNQIGIAGEVTDKKTEQLIKDLQSSDANINQLRSAFERERTLEEGRWLEKIGKLEKRYQDQLQIQKRDYENDLSYKSRQYEEQIEELQAQLLNHQKGTKRQVEAIEARLEQREELIKSLKNEKFELQDEITKKNSQIVNSKKDALDFKDELSKTKSLYNERIAAAKKPLESQIKELKGLLDKSEENYAEEIKALQNEMRAQVVAAKEDGLTRAGQVESDLQRQMNALKATSEKEVKELEAALAERDKQIASLEKTKSEQSEKLAQNAKEIKQLSFNLNTVRADLDTQMSDRKKIIANETRDLANEVEQLNDELIALGKEYEKQIVLIKKDHQDEILKVKDQSGRDLDLAEKQWQAQKVELSKKANEDATLIRFLNDEMVSLTGDLEQAEQELAAYEDNQQKLAAQLAKSEESLGSKVRSAKEPLEDTIRKLESELDLTKSKHELLIQEMARNSKNEIEDILEQHEIELKNEREQHADEIASLGQQIVALQDDGESALALLKKSYEDRIAALNTKSEEEKATSQAEWKVSVAQQVDRYEDQISDLKKQMIGMREEHENAIAEINEQHDGELAALNLKFNEEKRSYESEWGGKVGDQIENYEREIAELNSKVVTLQSEKDAIIEELHAEITQVKSDHANELASLREESNGVKSMLSNQISNLKDESEGSILSLREQLKEKESVISSLEKSNDELSSELQQKLAQINKFEDDIASLNENIAEEKLSYSEKLKFEKLSLGEKIEELNEELIATNRKYIEEINTLKESNYALTAQLKSEITDKGGVIEMLERENQSLTEEANEKSAKLARLEGNIADLTDQLTAVTERYEDQIADVQRRSENELADANSGWQEELAVKESEYKKTIADLTSQLTAVRSDYTENEKALSAQVETQATALSSLEIKNTDLEKTLDDKDMQIAKLQDKVAELSAEFADAKATQSQAVKLAKKPLEEIIQDLKQEISSIERRHKNEIEDMEQDLRSDLLKAEEMAQEKSADREVEWEERLEKVRDQYRDEIGLLTKQLDQARDGNDKRLKLVQEELQEEKKANARIKLDSTNLQLDLSEKERQLAKAMREVDELKQKTTDNEISTDKRIALAKESMAAEIKMLKSELAFSRDNHQEAIDFIKERAANDVRVAEEKAEAEVGAVDAKWKVKMATRDEEHRQELAQLRKGLESQLTGNRGELKKTIAELSEQLAMLKNSSESQIRELEDELVSREYQLGLRDGESQKRMTEIEQRWADKLAEQERKYKRQLEEKQQMTAEEHLQEKKELRQTVIDLTDELREIREKSTARIAQLEADLDKREFRLGFLEENSQQSTFEVDEKWRAKMTALDEKYKRELINQKQEIEARYAAGKQKQETLIDDLSKQIEQLKEQRRIDLALKEEEMAAELALLEGRHEKELSDTSRDKSVEVEDMAEKIRFQKGLIDELERAKSDVEFNLKQKEREIASVKAELDNLHRESKMVELSQSERLRLAADTSKAKIEDLTAQLALYKKRSLQEQMDLEDQWKMKLAEAEEEYINKLQKQRSAFEQDIAGMKHRLDESVKSGRSSSEDLRGELEENQVLIQSLSRDKYDLAARLDGKDREIVMLNQEIINLKESLDTYKEMASGPLPVSTRVEQLAQSSLGQSVDSSQDSWYDRTKSEDEYHSTVRKAILSKFQEFDFSPYAGKAGIVKIDFELFADGSPKEGPVFIGTEDEGLKGLLMECFKSAAPFPPFPEDLKKQSQRFALSVSFKQ